MNLVGAVLALAVAVGPASPPHTWSITMLDGSDSAASELFAGTSLAPGAPLESGYLVTHSADITGPIDITAVTEDAPTDFEEHVFITVGVNGKAGDTVRLDRLLRNGAVARATLAMPRGTARLTVSAMLDPSLTTQLMLRDIRFTFLITVSDQVLTLPADPGDPGTSGGTGGNGSGSGSGAGGSGSGANGDGSSPAGGLPATGGTISEVPLVLAAVTIGGGVALLLRRRRAGASPQNGRERA
jgi:LPXTG-motif cell wall-anchored protein